MNTLAPRVWAARRARVLLLALGLITPTAAPALADAACPDTPTATPIALPHLRSAIDHGIEVVIVALGSSSTQGAMASDLAHSYPAVLQQMLSAGLPQAHFAVINRGIGGQDATEELARLDADVLAVRPRLVIWQVGANGALRNVDPAIFRALVTTGVHRLQAAGADVILMDNQQSPRLLATPEEPVLDQSLAQVAADTGAALFSRRALMRSWLRDGAPFAEFIASDGLHHNDHGYFCIAESLGHSIVAGLAPHRPLTASR
jgi:lysophospholipase L1-like esterase